MLVDSALCWMVTPVFGYMLDCLPGFVPIFLPGSFCTAGCLLRGFAPVGMLPLLYVAHVLLGIGASWRPIVASWLAMRCDRSDRSLVLGAFFVQVTSMELLGKAMYTPWDSVLLLWGFDDRLLRYRITVSVCSVFCVAATIGLGLSVRSLWVRAVEEEDVPGPVRLGMEPATVSARISKSFCLLSAVEVFRAACLGMVQLLWPLYVKEQFQWNDHEFAVLTLCGSLSAIVTSCSVPRCMDYFGDLCVLRLLCFVSALSVLLAFPPAGSRWLHVPASLLCIGCVSALQPALESVATLKVAVDVQGRAFACLSACKLLGHALGSKAGATLFQASAEGDDSVPWWVAHGSLPFMLEGALLLGAAISLLCIRDEPTRATSPSKEKFDCSPQQFGT